MHFEICFAMLLTKDTTTVFPHCLYILFIGISGKSNDLGNPCKEGILSV